MAWISEAAGLKRDSQNQRVMGRLIPILMLYIVLVGCRNQDSQNALTSYHGNGHDTTSYPLLIEGGTRIVYQVGYMTADKGLKLYYDTIPHPKGGLNLHDSLLRRLSGR